MAIAKRTPLYLQCLLLAGSISLVACGGGGGDSVANKPQDTTPNPISFTASTNAQTNATVNSPTVAISGIDTATPVSISGGEYSISGAAFTSAAGSITSGQTLTVRLTASDKTNTQKTVTVTVGGVSATFSVTTLADVTPDTFSFTAKTEAELGKEYTSDAITVKGIDVAVPVSITGGTYSINGGAYTSVAGTVSADQIITVKTTSGNDTESTQNVVLTVGGVNATYAVTTIQDKTAPVAEFKFPTPYTMSEATSVKVRGTATDDHAIKSVKLVVRSFNVANPDVTISLTEIPATPKSDANGVKDFSSWTASIPLTVTAENEIKVIATDDRNNSILLDDANKVTIRQADVKSAFPDEDNAHYFSTSSGVVYDAVRHRVISADSDSLIATDITTGKRTIFASHQSSKYALLTDSKKQQLYARVGVDSSIKIIRFSLENSLDFEVFEDSNYLVQVQENYSSRALFLDDRDENNIKIIESQRFNDWAGTIYSFNTSTKKIQLLHGVDWNVLTDADGILFETGGAVYDKINNRYLFAAGGQMAVEHHAIVAVDPTTLKQTVFSSNVVGGGEKFSGSLSDGNDAWLAGLAINDRTQTLYVFESITGKLIEIDLKTGNRRLTADLNYTTSDTPTSYGYTFHLDEVDNVIYAMETTRAAVRIIDTETGEKVILSKSKNNF